MNGKNRKKSFRIFIDTERCKSCGLCIANCPKQILGFADYFNSRGVNPSECKEQSACIGCLSCADICPELAIQVGVEEREDVAES